MTCLQTEVPETENHLSNDKSDNASKQEFYFLSDVLPEDKVRGQYSNKIKFAIATILINMLKLIDGKADLLFSLILRSFEQSYK